MVTTGIIFERSGICLYYLKILPPLKNTMLAFCSQSFILLEGNKENIPCVYNRMESEKDHVNLSARQAERRPRTYHFQSCT